jgi:hypothetical protein
LKKVSDHFYDTAQAPPTNPYFEEFHRFIRNYWEKCLILPWDGAKYIKSISPFTVH